MAQRKLQRGRLQRHAVAVADRPDLARALEQGGRRGRVVVARAGFGIGEDPAVVDAAAMIADALLDADGEQLVERHLVEQRVAAGEQEAVEVCLRAQSG